MFTEGKVFMLNDQRYRLIKVRGTDLVLIGIDVEASVQLTKSLENLEEFGLMKSCC